jgi:hypothetical protein
MPTKARNETASMTTLNAGTVRETAAIIRTAAAAIIFPNNLILNQLSFT